MATPDDFTPDEWEVLRTTPHAVGMAVAVAGASGFTGTLKEAWTSASSVLEGVKSDNAILQRIADKGELKAAQKELKDVIREGDFKTVNQRMQDLAAERAGNAIRLLRQKGTAADVDAYSAYLRNVGKRVANAAKEGSFFGIGGERVSEGEQVMLRRLEDALG